MPEAENVAIGRLRWRVLLVTRAQAPQFLNVDPGAATGIDETLTLPQPVQADVQPVGALTFWGGNGEQIETGITHRIFLRWIDYVANADAVLRTTKRRDGTLRTETFRVRRVKEICGRKRFAILEVELERSA